MNYPVSATKLFVQNQDAFNRLGLKFRVNWIYTITIFRVHRSAITIHLFGVMPL